MTYIALFCSELSYLLVVLHRKLLIKKRDKSMQFKNGTMKFYTTTLFVWQCVYRVAYTN